jgi:hypothetical protein
MNNNQLTELCMCACLNGRVGTELNLTEHFSRQFFNFARNGELFPQFVSRVCETSPHGPCILSSGFRRE